MKNFEEIKKLMVAANAITKGFEDYDKRPSNADKVGMGFNLDSRFKINDGVSIHYSTWMGYYGDSSCSNIFYVDRDIFAKHFVKVLNNQHRKIMEQVAESIKQEATTLKDAAAKELSESLEKINSL